MTSAPRRLLIFVAFSLTCGCGSSIPEHDGYKNAQSKPWAKPKVLKLDERGEAEVDSEVSYPNRRRAQWFAVETPTFGRLTVKLVVVPFDDDQEVDLAYEVLDEDFRVKAVADKEEDDAAELTKTRVIEEADAGRYYIHVYAQKRVDEVEFTVRVLWQSGLAEYKSDFPANVAYIGPLAAVPLFDDSPARPPPKPTVRPRVREPKAKSISGRIAGLTATGTGTRIRIDRGSSAGVEKGWRGSVVSGGRSIPNGSFVITSVTEIESVATVKATPDQVRAAGRVRLQPGKEKTEP